MDDLIGYRVDSADGRLGVVVDQTGLGEADSHAFVTVRSGLFVERTISIPRQRIERVLPGAKRLIVRSESEWSSAGV